MGRSGRSFSRFWVRWNPQGSPMPPIVAFCTLCVWRGFRCASWRLFWGNVCGGIRTTARGRRSWEGLTRSIVPSGQKWSGCVLLILYKLSWNFIPRRPPSPGPCFSTMVGCGWNWRCLLQNFWPYFLIMIVFFFNVLILFFIRRTELPTKRVHFFVFWSEILMSC